MKPIEKILFCLFGLIILVMFIILLWLWIWEPSIDFMGGII